MKKAVDYLKKAEKNYQKRGARLEKTWAAKNMAAQAEKSALKDDKYTLAHDAGQLRKRAVKDEHKAQGDLVKARRKVSIEKDYERKK